MKKATYLFAVMALAAGFASCSHDDGYNFDNEDMNLETRATALGFPDAASYKASVAAQCKAGNHVNCDILNDGTHQPCANADHSGRNHDGTHHNGSDHGTCNVNGTCNISGHSHNNSQGNGNGTNPGNGHNNSHGNGSGRHH